MTRSDQSNSDHMPFVQVDRAAHALAAALGTRLGLPYQHVLGGLVVFWGINGAPRDIEALIRAGKSEVILSRAELGRRFNFAMGRDLDPTALDALELLGLVELRAEGFRVRGMARFFRPLEKRGRRQASAAAAGKASAMARAAKYGSAEPRTVARKHASGEPRSAARSADVRGSFDGRSSPRSASGATEHGPSVGPRTLTERGPNTEIRDQRPDRTTELLAPDDRAPRETDTLCDDFKEIVGSPYLWQRAKDGAAFAGLRKLHSLGEIRHRWRAGLKSDDRWLSVRTVAQLAQKWNDLADLAGAKSRGQRGLRAVEATAGSGEIVVRELPL